MGEDFDALEHLPARITAGGPTPMMYHLTLESSDETLLRAPDKSALWVCTRLR
jgi:hypothetical protein